MKIKSIMKPIKEKGGRKKGLAEDCDVYDMKQSDLDVYGTIIPIVNANGVSTGEIKKESLLKIITGYKTAFMQEVFNHLGEGIIAVDVNGVVFYANEKYTEIMGIPAGKIMGKTIADIEPTALLAKVIKTRETLVLYHQYVPTLKKFVSCRLSPIFVKGTFLGAVSIFTDASEIVSLNRQVQHAEQEVIDLKQRINVTSAQEKLDIIGQNHKFLDTLSQAAIVAETDAPVLIRGENGTGKEVIANFIHRNSRRSDKPLIMVNCASIPENLIESELFGYEHGAFTGSKKGGKLGKFEMANGGTLFLDEVGDISLSAQTKLLRAIQDNEIEKVGRERMVSVDVRIITATNQPLEELIANKQFRRDFYYRLNTVTLKVPALRDRQDDIPRYALHFLRLFNEKYQKKVTFPASVMPWLCNYQWPGNVRELKNCVENGVIMAQHDIFSLAHIKQDMDLDPASSEFNAASLKEELARMEKQILVNTLQTCQGNKTKARKLLALTKRTFFRKLKVYGINQEL